MARLLPCLLLLTLPACGASDSELSMNYRGEWRDFEASTVSLSIVESSTRDHIEVQGRMPHPERGGDEIRLTLRLFLQKEVLRTGSWTLPIRGQVEVPADVRNRPERPSFQAAEGHSEGVLSAWVMTSCDSASPLATPAQQFYLGRLELTENTPTVLAGWLELTVDGQVAGACGGTGVRLVRRHFRYELPF